MKLAASVHHIVPRIHSESSGTTYVVPRLCEILHHLGVDTHLHVIKSAAQNYPFTLHEHAFWSTLERIGFSPSMKRALLAQTASGRSIIHNHSLWMMPNVYAGIVAARNKLPLIVSPHGTVSAWALGHSARKKKLMWWLGQQKTFAAARCFHATAESEYEEIRKMGYRQPIAVIPNGVDFPTVFRQSKRNGDKNQVLFVGRLHPKKGLDNLLASWKLLHESYSNWELIIAGPEDLPGYAANLQNAVSGAKSPRVRFIGPVYGEEKARLYARADLFVLPTHSENFGITVAEALYQHTPAIVTEGAPWAVLNERDAGWWIGNTVEDLTGTLRKAMNLSDPERAALGKNGHDLVSRNFSWPEIGEKMIRTYYWMLTDQEKPNWIKHD